MTERVGGGGGASVQKWKRRGKIKTKAVSKRRKIRTEAMENRQREKDMKSVERNK